ncbi:hypothetical protein Tco_1088247, partial [Tanacetum coccineum]
MNMITWKKRWKIQKHQSQRKELMAFEEMIKRKIRNGGRALDIEVRKAMMIVVQNVQGLEKSCVIVTQKGALHATVHLQRTGIGAIETDIGVAAKRETGIRIRGWEERNGKRGRREHGRESEKEREDKEQDKDLDRPHRSGSRSERTGNERDREKSRDREAKDIDREKSREREVKDRDRERSRDREVKDRGRERSRDREAKDRDKEKSRDGEAKDREKESEIREPERESRMGRCGMLISGVCFCLKYFVLAFRSLAGHTLVGIKFLSLSSSLEPQSGLKASLELISKRGMQRLLVVSSLASIIVEGKKICFVLYVFSPLLSVVPWLINGVFDMANIDSFPWHRDSGHGNAVVGVVGFALQRLCLWISRAIYILQDIILPRYAYRFTTVLCISCLAGFVLSNHETKAVNRRYKDKKDGAVEPEVDPERDQRTVFAYQISLKADERDVYEFFSRAGK